MFTPYKKALIQRAQQGESCTLQSVILPLRILFGSVALPGTLVLADMSIDIKTIAYHVLSIILILEIQRALSALLEKFGRQPQL